MLTFHISYGEEFFIANAERVYGYKNFLPTVRATIAKVVNTDTRNIRKLENTVIGKSAWITEWYLQSEIHN